MWIDGPFTKDQNHLILSEDIPFACIKAAFIAKWSRGQTAAGNGKLVISLRASGLDTQEIPMAAELDQHRPVQSEQFAR
jgi:hypothetical protein